MSDLKLKKIIIENVSHHLDKCDDDTVSMAEKITHAKLYHEYEAMLSISHQITKLKKDLK